MRTLLFGLSLFLAPSLMLAQPLLAAEFSAPVIYPAAGNTVSIVGGDLNHDGHLDVVVSNANGVSVLLGNGDGTLQPAIKSRTGGKIPSSIAIGDFNNDGNLDLAVGDMLGSNIAVLLGNGDGSFKAAINTAGTLDHTYGMAAGDFNKDGNLDLAVSNAEFVGNATQIMLGRGDGTFTLGAQYTTQVQTNAIGVADFNQDGNLDLATTDACNDSQCSTGGISILLGLGDGTFQVPVNYNGSLQANGLAIADFNSDGILDVAFTTEGFKVYAFAGRRDGTFGALHIFSGNSQVALSLATADFDQDGRPDLAIPNSNSQEVNVILARQNGFSAPNSYPGGSYPTLVVAGDLNEDTFPDLVLMDNTGDVAVLLNTGGIGSGTLNPSSLDLGQVMVGQTKAQGIVLTNTGTGPMNVSSVSITGDTQAFLQHNNCHVLAVGSTCTIRVSFHPNNVGVFNASLIVTDDGVGETQTAQVTGSGTH